ncbi:uncharacterized protein STEHIDRAFT_94995 [Stereum hirsutum FP-91666 SS1]|uniref:uncharacterized protein n=1 Tax=Stereum hirsutum (strain FP-91666) TaxID=721885 RepID=UPI000440D486|nr:uncharacterized protein STEHIDRAFT_94995 [Stereum hirsutum FP-91666 SS1]EIM88077.1 hypothetical protein STEHIDRAFT_94995 [Stereum hirsutum FP-91666 SS1]
MLTFKPLSGAAKSDRLVPLAYLLQVDDVHILLDCGSPDWCPEFDDGLNVSAHWETYCQSLKEAAPTIDLVLLSHGDLAHSGLYPYAYARWGLKAPAYSTLPVQAMARIAATEESESIRDEQDVDAGYQSDQPQDGEDKVEDSGERVDESGPSSAVQRKAKYVATPSEVQEAFDSINTLRYSQPTHLQGKCQGVTITPFNAGHTLGGTIWKIRSPSAGTIMYAVNMNHMRERHLDGTVLMRQGGGIAPGVFEPLARPDLLITDAARADVLSSRRKDRDASLIDTITAALSSRSSLLLPCDASTRVLELLVLLDQHWSFARLKYPICLLSRSGREMLTFVRSMMEWLGGTVSKEDVGEEVTSGGRDGGKRGKKRKKDNDEDDDVIGAFALRFKHLEFFLNPQALQQTYSSKDPKLILAVPASLSHGPSRSLFADFASIPDNVVLLTSRGEEGTLSRVLFDRWNNAQRAEDKWDKGKIGSNVMMDGSLSIELRSKVALQGTELEIFLQRERAAKEKQTAEQAAMARNRQMLEADEDDSDDSESDSDSEDEAEDVERALGDDAGDDDANGMQVDKPPPEVKAPRRRRQKGSSLDGDGQDTNKDWSRSLTLGMDLDAADEGGTRQLLSFDIYLKGNVSKTTSFFKSAGGKEGAQRFRMFPYVEKRRKVDEYGEVLDVGMWVRRGKILEEDSNEDAREEKEKEEEAKRAPREPPSKFVSRIVEVQLACRLLFVDLEGLNDGRATKTIIPQVNPRKMIIVHGSPSATEALIDSCSNIRAMTKDVFAPSVGESVQIGQNTSSFSISLSDDLLASMKMSRFEDNEVGYVTGRIAITASSTVPILQPLSNAPTSPSTTTSTSTSSPSPMPLRTLPDRPRPIGSLPTLRLPHSTMIGELKLTALKSRLASIGIQSELVGEGVLICGTKGGGGLSLGESLGESVAVRKVGRGRVELEGGVSDVYFRVRKEIYGLHALVAA